MEEQRLEIYLSMPELDLTKNEDETSITDMSFSMYQIHKVEPMLFCVDTGAPYSYIGDKALERTVRHSGRRPISLIGSKRDFRFGDALVRS